MLGNMLTQKDVTEWCQTHSCTSESCKYLDGYLKKRREDIRHRCFVIELQLKGRSFLIDSPKWEEIGQICVDAGMAGFFWNKPDFNDDEWDDFCDSMNRKDVAWLNKDMGFWSDSGYGDGGYGVYAIKENNEIIALKICF